MKFDDFVRAGNQAGDPTTYEIENGALDRRGLVLDAMRTLAPWSGRRLLDLGCRTRYWTGRYLPEAASVVGVEPDPSLIALARARDDRVEILHGSAEHIPLPDASIDVVHARFAYFFGNGADAGLCDVRRVLAPGGRLVVLDNDETQGDFATLLARAYPRRSPGDWWASVGADCLQVMSDWCFDSREDLAAVLRLEFPPLVAGEWLTANPDRKHLTYGYLVFGYPGTA